MTLDEASGFFLVLLWLPKASFIVYPASNLGGKSLVNGRENFALNACNCNC